MSTGLILWGGRLDGREINTKREHERAAEAVAGEGSYVFTNRRSRDGRLILRWQRHAATDEASNDEG